MRIKHPYFFKFILLFIFSHCSISSLAQYYNNWFFGAGAGISFNADATPFVPFQVNGSNLVTYEGNSTISDEDGNLLFYTNGTKIYNRTHNIMLNGDNLAGNESAFQAAVIVKMPGNDSLFYVFTADAFENNFKNGYTYSIVNINRDSNNGEVIAKNISLSSSGTERLTATRHGNGTDIWIITNDLNSNTFRSWLITCSGLQPSPIVSTLGEVLNTYAGMNIGSLKVSPDGKQLCQTHFPKDDVLANVNFFQLFDFDNKTGKITNNKKITIPRSNIFAAEFSPNSQLLYLTNAFDSSFLQLEPKLPSEAAIQNSAIKIKSAFGFYGIQLGPNGKIFLDNFTTYLSVINAPNVKGPGCYFVNDQLYIRNNGRINLPFVLNDLEPDSNYISFKITDSCKGTLQFYGHSDILQNVQWEWSFGDGQTSTQQNPIHTFSSSKQTYLVKLKIRAPSICGYIFKSKYISPRSEWTKANFDFEVKCDSNYVRFINNSLSSDTSKMYQWNFGDGQTSNQVNPIHTYANPGTYNVQLKTLGTIACNNDSIQKTINIKTVVVQASADQTIIEGQSAQLSVSGTGTSYTWQPNLWLNNDSIQNPIATPKNDITYVVTATNEVGCKNSDSVKITVEKIPDVYMPSAFTPNNDGLNDILKPIMGNDFSLLEYSIYNRWGQKLFTTSEKGKGWNGELNKKLQPADVYIWLIRVKDKTGNPIQRKGSFVLIR